MSTHLKELTKQMTDYEYLASLPGIGDVTSVELLLEGGFLMQYAYPRQLIIVGLILRENSSDKQTGQKCIYKRGRRKPRASSPCHDAIYST